MEVSEDSIDDEELSKAPGMIPFVNKTQFSQVMPSLSLDEIKTFVTEYLKVFELDQANPAVGFKCTFTENQNAAQRIAGISPLLKDIRNDAYSLRAIGGWFRDFDNRRASATRIALNEILNQAGNADFLKLIKVATVGLYDDDAPPPDSYEHFALFNAVIQKISNRQITKTILGIKTYVKLANFEDLVDNLENQYGSLCSTTITKEEAIQHSRKTDGQRNDAHAILKHYLSYFSVNDETFIRALFPATRVETIFDVTAFAEVVRNGTLAAVHFNCAQTNATQVPTLKTLSKRLNECSEKILKFNADLLTTSRQEIESLNKQIEAVLAKQKIMLETKMPKVRLQVFLEHVQVLQKDALKLAKVMPWTKETFGIEMDAFEELIIDIKDKLEEATTNKKIEEDQKRNTTNEIAKMASSASSLPYLRGKSDFLPWIKIWEEIAPFLSSEITKINLIKTSLNKYDQMQTKHFTTLSPLLEYILSKYGQPLDQVPLLLQKLTNLKPPANWKESIYNIQVVLTTYTQLNDWDQQHRFDPWSRDCVKHKVIFGTMFLNFMKDIEEFDIQLNYKSSIVPTESFALQNIREAIKEGSSDDIEKQRREFFISKF